MTNSRQSEKQPIYSTDANKSVFLFQRKSMAALFIESDNNKSIRLLTDLAEQLGASVNKLTKPQSDHLHLTISSEQPAQKATYIISGKDNNKSQKDNADNPFISMRKRIKHKMTAEQIDNQIKAMRGEWQRDI